LPSDHQPGTLRRMPGPPQRRLTPTERKRLQAALAGIDKAEERWARLAKEFGYSVTAREMGLTTEAVRRRVLKILGPS
jgi:hypothetical protein